MQNLTSELVLYGAVGEGEWRLFERPVTREGGTQRERERSCVYWLTPQIATWPRQGQANARRQEHLSGLSHLLLSQVY